MPRRSGIGDLIPASGEGRALVEIKGRVGGKGSRMRRYNRGRPTKKERTEYIWMPQNNFQSNAGSNPGLFLSLLTATRDWTPMGLSTVNICAMIQPQSQAAGFAGGLTTQEVNALTQRNAKAKILGFQGSIFLTLPKIVDSSAINGSTDILAQASKPYLVKYVWRKISISPDGNQLAATNYDWTSASDEGWNTMGDRGEGAIMKWGHIWMQRTWGPQIMPYGTIGTAGALPSDFDLSIQSRVPIKKIPFPNVGKFGVSLTRSEALVLHVGATRMSDVDDVDGSPTIGEQVSQDTVATDVRQVLMFHDWRYKVAYK